MDPEDDALYEVTVDGTQIVGPVTRDQIRRGIASGRVPRDAKARPLASLDWRTLSNLLTPSMPPPPPGAPDASRRSDVTELLDPALVRAARDDGPSRPALQRHSDLTELLDPSLMRARTRLDTTLRGKWHLDVLLGIGGMASVYAATHRNGSRAAVKVLHLEFSTNPLAQERFVREGRVANAVGHEGAVKVLDDDVAEDGSLFLVTELLDGETLEERRLRFLGELDEDDVLKTTEQLLDVLATAHAKGVLHRDIKPENVFLTRAGQVKVLDFGIARLRELSTPNGATLAGTTMGTPAFMAPEQARGLWEDVDARTDLWAVGATMFTLLTGRRVHEARTTNEVLLAAMTNPAPPVASVLRTVSPTLARVIDRALMFKRDERWSDAREMQEAVRLAFQDRHGALIAVAPKPTVPDSVPNRTMPPPPPPTPTREPSPPVASIAPLESSPPDWSARAAGRRRVALVILGGVAAAILIGAIVLLLARVSGGPPR